MTDRVDDVPSDASIQAIAIAAPAESHAELARKSILAGKDVFVAKGRRDSSPAIHRCGGVPCTTGRSRGHE